ncbi:MAG: AAA family ATPase [Planctomycetota bacterium]
MYAGFYNLSVLPFENTPDPRFFFASEQHREALAAIEYAIRLRKGPVLVTGSIGSGKTTIGQAIIQRCRASANILQLVHGHDQPQELLAHLLRVMGQHPQPTADHAELLEALKRQLVAQAETGRPVVIFIDEAQTLTDAVLEELRLLSNFDTPDARLLQLVLIGQPELRERIAGPAMAPLRQRIALAKQLETLDRDDTICYIHHRLVTAAIDPNHLALTFDDDALERIHSASQGTPRLINALCDNCLLLGYVNQTHTIDRATVERVLRDMIPAFDHRNPPHALPPAMTPSEYRLAG